jgi:hypothetical protein
MDRSHVLLEALAPLLGTWETDAETPMGKAHCVRCFAPALGGAYVELVAQWTFGSAAAGYEERAYFGATAAGILGFWSFTSDGGRATGEVTDVSEVHADALEFMVMMPAGRARQAYWVTPSGSLEWVVDAETTRGWERLATHSYRRVTHDASTTSRAAG